MLSTLYYLFLVVLCLFIMALSTVALVVCWPFDKARRAVHRLSRILVRIFFAIPPLWRQTITGREYVDPRKCYVIVINHRAMIDIPTLYYLPLNFRWVAKRELFKAPVFGQFLLLHGDICINRGRAAEALEQLVRDGKLWLSRGASVAVFPEGTRSKDGEIHRFKSGAFTLAKEAGVEMLPVVMEGTQTLIKKNMLFNWGCRIRVKVLPPIAASTVAALEIHELMEHVRTQMCEAQAQIRSEK